MALARAIKGADYRGQQITWKDEEGNALDLTGATITAKIRRAAGETAVSSDGTFSLVTASSGIFSWEYGTAVDLAESGEFEIQFTATYGASSEKTFIMPFVVAEAL